MGLQRFKTAVTLVLIFLAGAYLESWLYITPFVTAGFKTALAGLQDIYYNVVLKFIDHTDMTALIVAVAGLLFLASFRYLARTRGQ